MALDNADLADVLERVADLLEAQHSNPYRVRAYRAGARTLRSLDRDAAAILADEGLKGLEALPGIGASLASAIRELVHNGHLKLLDRLEGQVSPEDLFTTVPGIGDDLAHRIHDELHVETLEELELAAHDGRLATVKGFGPRRVRAVQDSLQATLSRSSRRRGRLLRERETTRERPLDRPAVGEILAVDEEYRERAASGGLRRIRPRRFNPAGEAWLPVLHARRGPWEFTAMFSNTARAHRLGKTHDWVVIYHEQDGHEGQCTVVTEHVGPLTGSRVVRGREHECREHYAALSGSG